MVMGPKNRAIAGAVFFGCAGLLLVAVRVQPDERALGTHQQLGLPPCSMVTLTGYPCPTCGMTTAFAHAVRGHPLSAFRAQPAGLALAMTTIAAMFASLEVALTGRMRHVSWQVMTPFRLGLIMFAVFIGAWGYKLISGILSGTLPVA